MQESPLRKETHVIQLDQPERKPGKRPRRILPMILRALLPLAILAAGWTGYSILKVEPQEAKGPKETPKLIKTRATTLHVQDFPTTIRTSGIVRAHNEVSLTPRVAGKITRILPGFEDGAFFNEDDVLLQLDAEDFQTAVIAAEAQVARASSILAQEQTRAEQAKLNWEDLGYDEAPNDLVLRLPQLREAEANEKAAQAQLDQARRNLERTTVRAPFAGRVRRRTVGVGQIVGPATSLGMIFAIDFAEVRLPIAARDLPFLTLPEGPNDPTVDVQLRDALNEHSETVWTAKIVGTAGALDENSLELFAIARVIDPFARQSDHAPLRIGQPVVATIPGQVLEDVMAMPYEAVRQLDRVVLLEPNEPDDPNQLIIKKHRIVALWSDEEHVVVRDPNIVDGALLATSHLIYAPDGSRVEILPDPNMTRVGRADANDTVGVTKSKEGS